MKNRRGDWPVSLYISKYNYRNFRKWPFPVPAGIFRKLWKLIIILINDNNDNISLIQVYLDIYQYYLIYGYSRRKVEKTKNLSFSGKWNFFWLEKLLLKYWLNLKTYIL